MNRRLFLKTTGLGVIGISATGALAWTFVPSNEETLSIQNCLDKLDLIQQNLPSMSGEWTLAQTLQHCAQSVDYSIDGYPAHKSALFKRTVGAAAFNAFNAKAL